MLKKLRVFFKILTLLVITIVLGYSFFLVKNFKFEKSSNRDFNELKKVQFSTNGTITSKWLANNLELKKGLDLFDLDILELRTKLENVQQIKEVSIEKIFPDTLLIKIEERVPLLKFLVIKNGQKKLLFVDKNDGEIFEPVQLERYDLSHILSANLLLKQNSSSVGRFIPISGINKINGLVNVLINDFPEIFSKVKCLDLRDYDSRNDAQWSRIKLELDNGIIAVLGNENFSNQLMHLEFLIEEKCKNNLHNIKKIDVTSLKDAIVEYK